MKELVSITYFTVKDKVHSDGSVYLAPGSFFFIFFSQMQHGCRCVPGGGALCKNFPFKTNCPMGLNSFWSGGGRSAPQRNAKISTEIRYL